MPFDPTKPANGTPQSATEMRAQLNGLKALIDAAQAQTWSDRAVAIIKATCAGELLPRGFDNPNDWRCKACGHRERCWSQPP